MDIQYKVTHCCENVNATAAGTPRTFARCFIYKRSVSLAKTKESRVMRRLKILYVSTAALILQLIPRLAFASGEGLDIPEQLERKVPLEGLGAISLFFAKAYNENLWLYATYCTVLMAVVGIVIALGTDVILKALGMEVEKIEHKE
jgi:hypothetical protein